MSLDSHNSALAAAAAKDGLTEVFDPDFHFIYEVPTSAVVHLPPARLNITRLVLCRNYEPFTPASCAVGAQCKFVHVDCDHGRLVGQPIHVNYMWREEGLCTYPRLPAGETLEVVQPHAPGQQPRRGALVNALNQPIRQVPSELVLRTEGTAQLALGLQRGRPAAGASRPLWECVDFNYRRTCRKGPRCPHVHIITVNPAAKRDYLRAPVRPLPAGLPAHYSHDVHTQAAPLAVPRSLQRRRSPAEDYTTSSAATTPVTTLLTPLTNALEGGEPPLPMARFASTAATAAQAAQLYRDLNRGAPSSPPPCSFCTNSSGEDGSTPLNAHGAPAHTPPPPPPRDDAPRRRDGGGRHPSSHGGQPDHHRRGSPQARGSNPQAINTVNVVGRPRGHAHDPYAAGVLVAGAGRGALATVLPPFDAAARYVVSVDQNNDSCDDADENDHASGSCYVYGGNSTNHPLGGSQRESPGPLECTVAAMAAGRDGPRRATDSGNRSFASVSSKKSCNSSYRHNPYDMSIFSSQGQVV